MTRREAFIAEIIKRAGTPTAEMLNRLRGLLPPVLPEKESGPAR